MSAAALPAGSPARPRLVAAAPVRSVVPTLARQEARRLLLHPLTLVGLAINLVGTTVTLFGDDGPRAAFETTTLILTFYPGVLLILVGYLVATRDHRAGAEEMLAPVPARQEERVKAIALASLAPALLGLGISTAVRTAFLATDQYTSAPDGIPGLWHVLAAPVTLSGAVLYGLMLGVWSRARVTAVVGVVAIVVANVWVDNQDDLRVLGPAFTWTRWGMSAGDWAGVYAGSPPLHVAYLVALSALAFAAAWVRVAARRGPVVVLGLTCFAAALAAGYLQMPGGPL